MATYIKGSVIGKSETWEFEFRVLKRSAKVGLPQSAIDALGLSKVPGLSHDLGAITTGQFTFPAWTLMRGLSTNTLPRPANPPSALIR